MGWVLRLVAVGAEGDEQTTEVMEINRPNSPGNLADLGLSLAEAKQLLARLQTEIVAENPHGYTGFAPTSRNVQQSPSSSSDTRNGKATCANLSSMGTMQTAPLAGFTPRERDYIRRELDMFFSTLPTVAEGFPLQTWRGGPNAGKPKVSPTAGGLVERGLMRLDTSQRLPRLFFTEAGLVELRAMMADGRLADPKKFAHVRRELGIDPVD
ncbi:MAG: hypothetical protein ACJ8AI_16665 [Rhodopila sp.]